MTKAIIFKDQKEVDEFLLNDNNLHTVMIRDANDNSTVSTKGLEALRGALTMVEGANFYVQEILDEAGAPIYSERIASHQMKIEYKDGMFVFSDAGDTAPVFLQWEGLRFSIFPYMDVYPKEGYADVPEGYYISKIYDQSGSGKSFNGNTDSIDAGIINKPQDEISKAFWETCTYGHSSEHLTTFREGIEYALKNLTNNK